MLTAFTVLYIVYVALHSLAVIEVFVFSAFVRDVGVFHDGYDVGLENSAYIRMGRCR